MTKLKKKTYWFRITYGGMFNFHEITFIDYLAITQFVDLNLIRAITHALLTTVTREVTSSIVDCIPIFCCFPSIKHQNSL